MRYTLLHGVLTLCVLCFLVAQTYLVFATDSKVNRIRLASEYAPVILGFTASYLAGRSLLGTNLNIFCIAVTFASLCSYILVHFFAIANIGGSTRIILVALTSPVIIGFFTSYKAARAVVIAPTISTA